MFKYYNINPDGKRESDCVCRAISLATDTNYKDVEKMLKDNGVCFNCEKLNVDCYSHILDGAGFKKYFTNKTVAQLAKENPEKILLIRLEGHLTCCKYGCCYDIWNCTKEPATEYWIID